MTNALVERDSGWQTMKEQANMLIKTGFLPPTIKTAEQVLAIALTGKELGIGMMEAIRGVNVIQGKPSVSPQLMLALAIRTGQMESYSMKSGPEGATVTIKRKGWPEHIAKFGPADAKGLGLDGKDNYRKQAPLMYQWRALAQGLRFTFPDAISGIYTFEEMGANVKVEDDGSISLEDVQIQPSLAMPEEKKNAAIETQADDEPISDDRRRKLFRFAEAAWGPSYKEDLKIYLKSRLKIEHTSDLDLLTYQQALDELAEIAKTRQPDVDLR